MRIDSLLENRLAHTCPDRTTRDAVPVAGRWVHEQIELQAEKAPGRVAVSFGDQVLTYGELNARSTRLASQLRTLGVKKNDLVIMLAERSLDMVVGLLGVLKAGAAYVPLDPSHPADRLAYVVQDSGARVLLTQTALRKQAQSLLGMPSDPEQAASVMLIDGPIAALHEPVEPVAIGGEDLAYVIYTSGSTGRPKGVMVPHRALANFLHSMARRPGFDSNDVLLAVTTISFDIAGLELWLPLAQGARCHLVARATVRDAEQLMRCIEQVRPTVMQATPALWTMLFLVGWRNAERLRALCGGEAMSTSLKQHFVETDTQAWNMYGPTETTIWSTVAQVRADQPVFLGDPIAETKLLVLDEQLRPVAEGSEGELCIAGAGVARGYWNRPELTVQKFIEHPLVPDGRVYRTGDRVRLGPGSALEYIGRIDFQVKIRGYRVEPGEVEALLKQHPAVRDAVVVAQGEGAENKRLVAFVIAFEQVLHRQTEDSVLDSIRRYMQEKAPDYMWPAAVVLVDHFPLTANGKIDRLAFPAVDCQVWQGQDFALPQTPQEQMLVDVWAEQLGMTGIGRNAHFFNLGGHSLQIVNVMLALRRRGIEVDVHTLYQYPILSQLALQLPRLERLPQVAGAPSMQSGDPETSLAALDSAERAVLAAAVPGGLANIKEVGPLGGAIQQGMLYHMLAHPEGDPYVLWQVIRFEREDLLHAYLDALRATIARHDALRVGILHQGLTQPLQVLWREAELAVEALTGHESLAELKRRCRPDRQGFDLAVAPLQRCTYCQDSATGQWVLLHQLHHLTVDHVSLERMQREIEDRLLGREPAPLLPVSPLQILASLERGQDLAGHKAFFDAMLVDYEPVPAPLGMARPLTGNTVVVDAWRSLAVDLGSRIRQQARGHGVSVAAIFHLAWAKVVACLGGRDDVVFGTVLGGRMQLDEAAQEAFGLFINTLPIRLRMEQQSVLECLWHTQDALMQLLKHEQAPLALAQKSAQLPGTTPLFTTLLNYRHSNINPMPSAEPFKADKPSAVAGIGYSGIIERTTYPVAVNVDDLGDGFAFNAQVEQGQDPERICDYFETALEAIVRALDTAPNSRAGRLMAMPMAERERILHQWNRTDAAFPDQACLHELIEAQVRRTPNAVAVEFGGNCLTYAELNRQANRLARHLVTSFGVKPDAVVGVCAERSLEMVVALLAVLKAGGAYVPLDPHYPDERLCYMLQDSAPTAVLSHAAIPATVAALLAGYAAETGATVVDLEASRSHWPDVDEDDLPVSETGVTASSLAYVIYTSGSTGRPKGVMNEHRGVVNRLVWMQKAYRLTADDAVLQKTPFSFDVSVWEFFWPLMYGARLVVAKPEGHKDPLYLSGLIQTCGITTMHFVPSMLSAFLDHAAPQAVDCLRRVFCSGEALPAASVRRFRERFPTLELHNLYGPTEAAIDVTAWDCREETARGVIPIGRPIDNIRIHILDTYGQPCPVGVAGELHIAGVGVARGYLGQPGLTAEKFIEDSFHAQGSRMYRTGDIARYLPAGEIEYVGRNDFQVKLRGFRIELGEIEAALSSHPAVKECVVMVRQDVPGDARLVAYLVGTATVGDEASAQSLRAHLRGRLPDFMASASLVWLDALPLTANGKLDRKALPSPADVSMPIPAGQPLADGTQTRLARIWSVLLNQAAIGPQTHFYEAGGHSLLAVTLMARIREEFGLSLPLSAIVAHLDLASQAALIDAELAQGLASADSAAALPAGGRIRALPAQKAIYKAVRLNPSDLSNNSFIALAFDAEPDLKVLRNLLQTLFARHEALSARFVLENDDLYLQPSPRFMFRLEKRQTLGSLEDDLRDFMRPFSLEDGMNVRGRWVTDGPKPVLLLDFSHAVIDGVGLARLMDELAAGSDDAALNTSLAVYSEAFHGAEFAALRNDHAEYWHHRLRGWLPAPQPNTAAVQTRSWQFAVGAAQKSQIEALAAQLRISLPEFFMAVFLGLKAQLERQPDQLVSMIFHGRDQLAQQAVIAPLMTVLPVRVGLPAAMLSAASLCEVSAAVRAACRHYLFEADMLATRWPELTRQALFAPAFFGYFKREGFTGRIAGQPCLQLETPLIAGGQAHWNLTCEIAEHATGFDVRLEALAYRAVDSTADWEALFRSLLEGALTAELPQS
ncbi:non-ribosomal peptide synthetase [Massilia scottii]|uniref:non-ribosomal peptide synthetase n=1 Tax=Massilia scottii TaxID=3057166 RepID=UPI002796A391|nr:non-ribosomal peptide synthetase [Massilia sp. CCM 9029]MDQ1834736.1 amino acid adenylation domain-containing protein [Massilia sp. CCM 9029]